jgi:hypothetical protein
MVSILQSALASDAIVFVVNTSGHPSYKTNSTLLRTLLSLQKYYLDEHPTEVIVFYTGHPVTTPVKVRWVKLDGWLWSTPKDTPELRKQPGYKEGYRHMCQFFSFRVWKALANYSYIMRMDDDSSLCGRVTDNIFETMRRARADYGYRMLATDGNDGGFNALVKRTPARKPYNNFFVARVGFFLQPKVQQTLLRFDRSRQTYTHRMGDLHVHGHIICKHKAVLVRFDMCYVHATVRNGCPANGGMAGNKAERARFKRRFGGCSLCERDDVVGARDVCVPQLNPCGGSIITGRQKERT